MNEYLSTLGLCLRAGKLTAGIEAVSDHVASSGDVRLILLSSDAGETTVRRLRRAAEGKNIPIVRLGAGSEEIGAALGRAACAVCCIQEIGFAAAIMKKAAEENPELAPIFEQIQAKNIRIASRRGKKKPRKGTAGSGGSRKAKQSTNKKRGGERA
jgi:ribosomal protein L7Ae-like RNA K-turn-binding protein